LENTSPPPLLGGKYQPMPIWGKNEKGKRKGGKCTTKRKKEERKRKKEKIRSKRVI
jgi:hypothetical protein